MAHHWTLTRYTYGSGYKTRQAALDMIEDGFAAGEISESERPQIESYTNAKGQRRYLVTLLGY